MPGDGLPPFCNFVTRAERRVQRTLLFGPYFFGQNCSLDTGGGGGGVLSVYFFSTFCERRLGSFSALDKLLPPSCDLHVLICC